MMLAHIKNALRITTDKLDLEIRNNIDACLLDLERVGVVTVKGKEDDALIIKACELYVKWQEDFDGKSENYQKAYEKLRDSLSLCGDYNV